MDNATHAIAGLWVAQVILLGRAHRGRPVASADASSFRWLSLLANNLPDLDAVYARRLGGKLGYLLHHRGHSHTLPAALLLGLALFAGWLWLRRRRELPASREVQRTALALCLFGPLLHVALDFLNNYGVHPFWPFDRRWFYGESLFIVEPWLWVWSIPALLPELPSRAARAALSAVLGLGLALAWGLALVPWSVALCLTLGAGLSALICRRLPSLLRCYFGLAASLATIALFALSAHAARALVERELSAVSADRHERRVDLVLTPAPGDPLCFGALALSVRGDRYLARAASVSLLPGVLPPAACRIQATGQTLGLWPPSVSSSPAVNWQGEWAGSLGELRRLSRRCEIAALLRFARVPFWRGSGQSKILIGDMRFDRDPDLDFDELELPARTAQCPPFLPDWQPPRRDLVGDI